MPEGDAVYRFAQHLREALAGHSICAARAHGPGPVPRVERLIGATCQAVQSRGKNLFIEFDNGLTLRGHLRMYGTWHIYRHGESWRRPEREARLVLETAESVVVNFSAPVIELLESRSAPLHTPVRSLGPDLLAPSIEPTGILQRFRQDGNARRTIGDAIMDQRIMAGVGNIWKHETLFRCRVNPWCTVGELSDEDLTSIIQAARDLLLASVHRPNGLGLVRRPRMFVYMRFGRPCLRCNTLLKRSRQGEDIRFTTWCPSCQPIAPGQHVLPGA